MRDCSLFRRLLLPEYTVFCYQNWSELLIQVRSAKIKYGLIFVPKPIRLHNKTNSEICFIWQILDQSPKLTTVTTPLTLFRTKLFAFKDTFFNSRNVRGIDHHFGCYCLIVHHCTVRLESEFCSKTLLIRKDWIQ